jgi:Ca2+-transporting ATPase
MASLETGPLMEKLTWHAASPERVLEELGSDPNRGLAAEEVELRLQKFGANELRKEEKVSPLALFINQFKNWLIIILMAAIGLSVMVGEVLDAILIAVIVLLSALLGFFQEYKA